MGLSWGGGRLDGIKEIPMARKQTRPARPKAPKPRKISPTMMGVIIAAVSAAITAVATWAAIDANAKTDENLVVNVERSFLADDSGLDNFGPGFLFIRGKWVVDIYNISSAPVSISKIDAFGFNAENMTATMTFDEKGESDRQKPFSIPAGDLKRVEIYASVPVRAEAAAVAAGCNCTNISDFRKFMASKGFDELGNRLSGDKENAAVLVTAKSARGRAYPQYGKWFSGLGVPKYRGGA